MSLWMDFDDLADFWKLSPHWNLKMVPCTEWFPFVFMFPEYHELNIGGTCSILLITLDCGDVCARSNESFSSSQMN